jgi:5-methyltetrahydrofolate--homocysteine methyltransferase
VHVLDASRGVGVLSQLLSAERRDGFVRDTAADYDRIRQRHGAREQDKVILPLEDARRRRAPVDWSDYVPPVPCRLGVGRFESYSLAELAAYVDWAPLFATWELRGAYPGILDDPAVGAQARSLLRDARELLQRIVRDRLLRARAVFGFFPANATESDDVALYRDERRRDVVGVMHGLRQQFEKPPGRPNLCLTDWVAPSDTGRRDYVGGFAVTAGLGLDDLVGRFERDHDDYSAIMAKALADRLAEAFAERLHQRVRTEFWGYASDERLDHEALIAERFRGIRPAPGYPACPEHTEKRTLFALLDAERAAGISLTESCAMWPAASVSGWYLAHPEAHYFGVGRIGRDQVEDYARRKGWSVAQAERWLGANLAYEPEPRS